MNFTFDERLRLALSNDSKMAVGVELPNGNELAIPTCDPDTGETSAGGRVISRRVVPWDTTSKELQRAHDAALKQGFDIDLAGATYTITDPVVLRTARASIFMEGATIDCTNMLAPYAIQVDAASADPAFEAKRRMIRGPYLKGPGAGAGALTGLLVKGTATGRSPRPTLIGGLITGFQYGIDFNDYAYLSQLYSLDITYCGTAIRESVGVDAGENIAMYGCGLYNNTSQFWLQDDTSEFFLHGCSMDYSQYMGLIERGQLWLTDCHVEYNGATVPAADWCRLDGNGASFVMRGGKLLLNDIAGPGPFAFDHLFNINNVDAHVRLIDVHCNNLKNTTQKIATGVGAKNFRCRGLITYANTNILPSRSTDAQDATLLFDGAMENTAVADEWFITADTAAVTDRLTGTNVQILKTGAVKQNGTYSLRATKVGAAGTTAAIALLVPLQGHKRLSAQFAWQASGVSGSVALDYRFVNHRGYDGNGVPLVTGPASYASATLTPGSASWATQNGYMSPEAPEWATHVRIRLDLTNMGAGNFHVDDLFACGW